jgi:hypothetical protein
MTLTWYPANSIQNPSKILTIRIVALKFQRMLHEWI